MCFAHLFFTFVCFNNNGRQLQHIPWRNFYTNPSFVRKEKKQKVLWIERNLVSVQMFLQGSIILLWWTANFPPSEHLAAGGKPGWLLLQFLEYIFLQACAGRQTEQTWPISIKKHAKTQIMMTKVKWKSSIAKPFMMSLCCSSEF